VFAVCGRLVVAQVEVYGKDMYHDSVLNKVMRGESVGDENVAQSSPHGPLAWASGVRARMHK
jgi:hypothetical protein